MNQTELTQLFAFDRWANNVTLEALGSLGEPPTSLIDLCWHVFAAADNWLGRIDREAPAASLAWGDDHSLDDLGTYAERMAQRTTGFGAAMTDTRLAAEFEYRNSAGEPFRNVVGDVLQHVMLHGIEHRAQIMWEVGKLGGQPAEIEYIWFIREGGHG